MIEDRGSLSALTFTFGLIGAIGPATAIERPHFELRRDGELYGVPLRVKDYFVQIADATTPSATFVIKRSADIDRASARAAWIAELVAMREKAIADGMRLLTREEIADELARRRSLSE